ncbi:MAG: YncE family protein [Planctomycetes bacterium]|nr:YncE family protein [Planctomycetota bacterium]
MDHGRDNGAARRAARAGFPAAAGLLLAASAAAVQLDPAGPDTNPDFVGRAEVQGIAVELHVRPVGPRLGADRVLREGEAVEVEFRIADTTTGRPQTRLSPGAWIHTADPAHDARAKVRAFLSGGLYGRPRMDLNSFFVVTLNHRPSLSVVDPLFGYGGSRLLAQVELAAPGSDWLFDERTQRLFVTEHDTGSVAVVDTRTWKLAHRLRTPAAPTRVELQPDGRYVWIGCDAGPRSGVFAFDARTLDPMAELATGAGHHELDFSTDSRFAFVTNELDGTLAVIDTGALEVVERHALGGRLVAVATSPLASAVHVVDAECGRVFVLDERTRAPLATIETQPGVAALRFEPAGRLGFLANPLTDQLLVLDSSARRIVQSATVEGAPDQVVFTQSLAYVRSPASELVTMVPLEGLGAEGEPIPLVDFSGGQKPLGNSRGALLAEAIAPAPGGASVVVANPGDRAVYYYKEGMAAPMGNFETSSEEPRAALVVDRSLREATPGSYRTQVELTAHGMLDVVFFLDAPRIAACFELRVAPDPARTKRPTELVLTPVTDGKSAVVGETYSVRLRAEERDGGALALGLPDLEVLVFNTTGWQVRSTAVHVGEGVYETAFAPPRSGSYYVSVECPSRGLQVSDLSPWILRALEPTTSGGGAR